PYGRGWAAWNSPAARSRRTTATFHWKTAWAQRARIWNHAMYASARSLDSAVPIASACSTEASQVRAAFSPSAAAVTLSWEAMASASALSASRRAPIVASSDWAWALRASARACATRAAVLHGSRFHDRPTTRPAPLRLYGLLANA